MKSFILFFIFLLMISTVSFAQEISNAGMFLERGVGTRQYSLGSCFVGLVNDSTATYYNSAGLSTIETLQIDTTYTKLYGDIDQSCFTIAIPINNTTGIGILYFSSNIDNIKETVRSTSDIRTTDTNKTFSAGDKTVFIGYGTKLTHNLSIGTTLKYINSYLYNNQGNGIGIDLGLLYFPKSYLGIGLNIQNIVQSKIKWDTDNIDYFPQIIVVGVSIKKNDLIFVSDVKIRDNRYPIYGLGLEYNYNNILFIRSGLQNNLLSVGIGIKNNIFNFNYTYINSPDEVLESNSFFSFGFNFKE